MKLKIALGNGPLLATLYFANFCLRKKKIKISTIFICPFQPKKGGIVLNPIQSLIFLINQIGFRFLGFNILEMLSVKIINILNHIPFFSKEGLWSFSKLAKEFNLRLVYINSFNSEEFREILREEKFDFLLINGSDQILKKETIEIPKLGCFNFHTSLLPEYQGIDPIFQMMINNEDHIGVTFHQMTPKVDQGPIYLRKKKNISPDLSYYNRRLILMEMASELLNEFLNNQSLCPIKVDAKTLNQYRSWPNRQEVKRFFALGHVIIRWKELNQALRFQDLLENS